MAANIERTGKRKLTRLSSIAREIEGVRHFDLDLYQTCASCKRPQMFSEVKSYLVPDAEWDQVRRHAAFYGHSCLGLLVVESAFGDIGVKVYDSADNTISKVCWDGEDYLIEVLERARDAHTCW